MAGNELSLVMMAAARAVGVDFLHGDDIGVKRVDDSGDTFGADFAINARAAVDIIRHHAESGLRLTCLVMRRSFFALRIAAEEMEGDLMQVFAADAAGGSGDVSGVPALDAVGDQEEPSGFFRTGPAMRSVFLGKSQWLLGGIPAGQNDVSGVGVLAELYQIGRRFFQKRMVCAEQAGAFIRQWAVMARVESAHRPALGSEQYERHARFGYEREGISFQFVVGQAHWEIHMSDWTHGGDDDVSGGIGLTVGGGAGLSGSAFLWLARVMRRISAPEGMTGQRAAGEDGGE